MNVGNLYCNEQSRSAEGSCFRLRQVDRDGEFGSQGFVGHVHLPETAPRLTTLAGCRPQFLNARWIAPGRRQQRPSDVRIGSADKELRPRHI